MQEPTKEQIEKYIHSAEVELGPACEDEWVSSLGQTLRELHLLRASVPDRYKQCESPIGAVQSYIADLESELRASLGIF